MAACIVVGKESKNLLAPSGLSVLDGRPQQWGKQTYSGPAQGWIDEIIR